MTVVERQRVRCALRRSHLARFPSIHTVPAACVGIGGAPRPAWQTSP